MNDHFYFVKLFMKSGTCMPQYVYGGKRPLYSHLFFPSIMWVLKVELSSDNTMNEHFQIFWLLKIKTIHSSNISEHAICEQHCL